MANQVTLTFAGDDKSLSATTDDVNRKLGENTKATEEAASGYERFDEGGEVAEQRAQGFADTIDGTSQAAAGFGQIMSGDVFGGLIQVGQGVASVAGGFTDFLLPALAKTKVATLAQSAAQKVAAAGTTLWTGAQRLLNLAFVSSPIGWIVLGIGLLVAAVVLIATKTTWFQTIWRVAWSGIKTAAQNAWNFIKAIPGWTETAFKRIASVISAPYRAAFNLIARAWNSTIGRLSFTVPSWVPGLGGDSISVPNLPTFDAGGTVPGQIGQNVLAIVKAGERIGATTAGAGGNAAPTYVRGDGVIDVLIDAIAARVGRRGGRPDQLGIKIA